MLVAQMGSLIPLAVEIITKNKIRPLKPIKREQSAASLDILTVLLD